jgi:hypothetical protein
MRSALNGAEAVGACAIGVHALLSREDGRPKRVGEVAKGDGAVLGVPSPEASACLPLLLGPSDHYPHPPQDTRRPSHGVCISRSHSRGQIRCKLLSGKRSKICNWPVKKNAQHSHTVSSLQQAWLLHPPRIADLLDAARLVTQRDFGNSSSPCRFRRATGGPFDRRTRARSRQ